MVMALATWAMTILRGWTPSASPSSLGPYCSRRRLASAGARPARVSASSSAASSLWVRPWAGRERGLLDWPEMWSGLPSAAALSGPLLAMVAARGEGGIGFFSFGRWARDWCCGQPESQGLSDSDEAEDGEEERSVSGRRGRRAAAMTYLYPSPTRSTHHGRLQQLDANCGSWAPGMEGSFQDSAAPRGCLGGPRTGRVHPAKMRLSNASRSARDVQAWPSGHLGDSTSRGRVENLMPGCRRLCEGVEMFWSSRLVHCPSSTARLETSQGPRGATTATVSSQICRAVCR